MWASKFELQVFTGRVFCLTMTEYDAKIAAEPQPQRRVLHLPVQLHLVSRLRGKGFRHFDGSSAPKCSSHPLSNGSCLASCSSVAASSWHALRTRKAPRLIWSLISLLVGGRASIPTLALISFSTLSWSNVSTVILDLAPAQMRTSTSLLVLHLALTRRLPLQTWSDTAQGHKP